MKLIYEPSVYVVGYQQVDDAELSRFLEDHGFENWATESPADCQTLIEVGARTCYQSWRKGRPHKEHIEHIKEVGHGSVLEHAVFSLLVTGVSRSLTHELVRHRAGVSPSQLSQRYVDESDAEYVVPPDLAEEVGAALVWEKATEEYIYSVTWDEWMRTAHGADPKWSLVPFEQFESMAEAGRSWLLSVRFAHKEYVRLVDYLAVASSRRGLEKTESRKFARQTARSVLPNCTETKICLTANARALRHFVEQRASRFAEPEIRRLANRILEVVRPRAPDLFGDYQQVPLSDGTYEVTTEHRKV